MKKLLALLLATMMVFALVACGGNEENPSGSNDNTPSNSEQQEQPGDTNEPDQTDGNLVLADGMAWVWDDSAGSTYVYGYVFRADGTYNYYTDTKSKITNVPGTWTVSGNELELEYNDGLISRSYTYEIDNGKLILNDGNSHGPFEAQTKSFGE